MCPRQHADTKGTPARGSYVDYKKKRNEKKRNEKKKN